MVIRSLWHTLDKWVDNWLRFPDDPPDSRYVRFWPALVVFLLAPMVVAFSLYFLLAFLWSVLF